jgi:hypothetical protein
VVELLRKLMNTDLNKVSFLKLRHKPSGNGSIGSAEIPEESEGGSRADDNRRHKTYQEEFNKR